MADRFQEPALDPNWSNPTVSVTRFTIIADVDELEDALNGFRQTFDTAAAASAELSAWSEEQQARHRVVKVTATVSEVEP